MSDSEDEEVIKWSPPDKFYLPYEEHEEEEWNEDHLKLLYMVSLYAKCAMTADEREGWIRQLPLYCLMYEGVAEGVLDFDYAPQSLLVSYEGRSRRVWLNITQEGKAAVDDLREKRMLGALKLATEDFQPVTAYQCAAKGLAFLEECMTEELKAQVHRFVYPKDHHGHLLIATFDGEKFYMTNRDSGHKVESGMTETEDVSYVSSPWLPDCLRADLNKPMTSNSSRSHESALGGSTIKDGGEDGEGGLDEAIVLSHVHALVGEWIPFGSNQIVALNERLGALDRCQGGLFTAQVDTDPTSTQFDVPPGLTQVTILDFDFVHFINFEAEINYPEEDGIVQVENFGMHLNVDGTIVYGVFVDAVVDRLHDDISVDHLARLLVDVHQDSSSIMDDLLSQYQRSLMDLIYMGDAQMRNKFNCIIADEIKPAAGKLVADQYIDKGDNENELKQVLGDIYAAHDLSRDDVVIRGRDGILLGGPSILDHTTLIIAFVGLLTRELYIRNFFVRTFVLDDMLKKIRILVMTYQKDPNHIQRIRDKLNDASRDIILLQEILEYLKESLDEMVPPAMGEDRVSKRIYKVLDVPQMRTDIIMRCTDLVKLIHGANNTLTTLQRMSDVINTKQLEDVFKNVESNTKYLVDASAANERSSAALDVMQVILAGSFCFDILDRLSGGTLNIVVPDWIEYGLVRPVISKPMAWWFINMAWLSFMSVLLLKYMAYLGTLALGALSVRVSLNRKIDVDKLNAFLKTRAINVTDQTIDADSCRKKLTWDEEDADMWSGDVPTIEIFYDETHAFLLSVYFQIDTKKSSLREKGLLQVFIQMFGNNGIFGDDFDLSTEFPALAAAKSALVLNVLARVRTAFQGMVDDGNSTLMMFRNFDKDGGGGVDPEELREGFEGLNVTFTDEEYKALLGVWMPDYPEVEELAMPAFEAQVNKVLDVSQKWD